jgi:hypothetical protein
MDTNTPWGRAAIVEEVAVDHDTGERRYDAIVQLLETRDGVQLVRFGSRANGAQRLNCLTLRADELQALEEALIETERLASVLRLAFG